MPQRLYAAADPARCRIYIDALDRPVGLAGEIVPTTTADRELVPDPVSSFACAGTPFDKGHIMALQLGGPDVSENIVPQYGIWQRTGAWRQIEAALHGAAAALPNGVHLMMLTDIVYANAQNQYAVELAAWQAIPTRSWQDRLIPTRFTTWTGRSDRVEGHRIAAILNGAPAQAAAALSNVAVYAAAQALGAAYADLDHSVMPADDRLYWRQKQMNGYVRAQRDAYVRGYNAAYQRTIAGLRGRHQVTLALAAAGLPAQVQPVNVWYPANAAWMVADIQAQGGLAGWTPAETQPLAVGDLTTAYYQA